MNNNNKTGRMDRGTVSGTEKQQKKSEENQKITSSRLERLQMKKYGKFRIRNGQVRGPKK